jgi:LPXTG-site transpeptidase (sortase) family protein
MPAAIEQAAQPLDPAAIAGKPVRLQVEGIDIAIIEGIYNAQTGAWTLTDDKAQFALPTALPNDQSGNTLIYGHNTPRVFADLHALAPGAQARIYTDNDHVFTYAYRSSETVSPTATDIFAYTGSPQLTLQTCTGFWSEQRKFFYFELVAVK